ncbi:Arc family DNA-binding protein [Ancylobacter sp.]|uniref:Arc family DNA-binding protein n=1 Tax=Ancylobacter sp. TaxID=1872567 RepID=UPI003D0BB9E6
MSEDDRVQYKFMIPASLKARLEDQAHENRRSLSAEIISRLEQSFSRPLPEGMTDPTEWLMIVRGVVDQALQQSEPKRTSLIGPYRKPEPEEGEKPRALQLDVTPPERRPSFIRKKPKAD